MNEYLIAVILGVVEGVTEFLPVSSTGHLIVFGEILGFRGPVAETFEIFIQLAAILAVLVLFRERFFKLIPRRGRIVAFEGTDGILKLGVACIPAFVFGALLHRFIKEHLFSVTVVSYSLIIGGIVLLLVREKSPSKQEIQTITYKECFLIGVFQCLSLCPGVSRAGATILGGMWIGLSRGLAAEFSFLLAVPTMMAAVGYDLFKSYHLLSVELIPLFVVGFLVSFVTALIVVKSFMAYLQNRSFALFGWYRIVFGLVLLLLFS